jgi:phage tail sheath protein FI
MPEYFSPGVYVEEIPSAVQPIAGVSTSTAAFIGIVPDTIQIVEENPAFNPQAKPVEGKDPIPPFITWTFPFPTEKPDATNEAAAKDFDNFQAASAAQKDAEDKLKAADKTKNDVVSSATRTLRLAQKTVAQYAAHQAAGSMADENVPVLCTTFGDFKRSFGGFSNDALVVDPKTGLAQTTDKVTMQNTLAHAVFGFFNNGGTRCWVMRAKDLNSLRDPEFLTPLEAIDEISLVAAPGVLDKSVQQNLIDYSARLKSCFAILDGPVLSEDGNLDAADIMVNVTNSDYAALYFPWIKVFDPATQAMQPDGDGEILCPPSGHIAGIYSRVDHERGVFKAPANEVIRGALELDVHVSRSQQDGLNPVGVNCVRFINDDFKVWGARTIGGDGNADLKYINVRRTLIFLRESIDRGTQWAVFEPNDRSLWAKITRNVSAFLTTVWRDGALFGSTPQEAFYVKCDDETNPPENRDLGMVTTEIGVAIVRPAEFVIFRISQWQGPATS